MSIIQSPRFSSHSSLRRAIYKAVISYATFPSPQTCLRLLNHVSGIGDGGVRGVGGRAMTWGTCSALDCVEHVLETVDGDFKRNRGGEHPAEDLSFSSAWIAAPMALDSISIWGATYRPMPWAPRCTCSVYHCRAGGLFCHGWAREAGRCCIVLCSHL